ncbi:phage tail spike protein [Gemella sp.]
MKLFLFNNDEKLIGTVSPLECIQNEEINKIQTIECTVVYSELIEKASYIGHKDYSDNRIFHLYKIDHVTKTSTTDVKIVGVHTFFDDMESDGYVKDFRPTNREVVGVLTTILDGSRWQLGSVNVQRNYTGNFYYVTRKEAISKLIEATQIEIKPRLEFSRGKITGRYLDVFTRLGGRNGKVFVHGRDLLTVSEKKSQGAIYTAVVGRGKGEETDTGGYGRRISFKDVVWTKSRGNAVDKPAGQEYVEIPAMTKLYGFEKGTKPRIKIVEFQDETDKEKLLRLSYEWLKKNSRMQVEYSAKVLNVGNLELGDTVGIFNPKLGIKYETRVFKVKRNLVDNKLTEFGIGDKVTTSPFSRTIELAKEMKNFQDDTVYWLDKIRERLSDKLINEDGYNYDLKADNEYKVPAGYYSFDKPIDQNPTKVVYMGAGKIAIANSKKPTGEWNWKTFLDGTGATLDLINTGVLKAGRIQSADGRNYWDLDTGEFHLEQSAINEAVKTVVNGKVQEIVGEVKKNLPTKEELKGKSSYLHKKYSDFADGRNMDNNSNRKYIGIYTGDKATAPTSASEYSWTKIRGEDGARGRDGADGKSINRNYIIDSNKLNTKQFYSWNKWEKSTSGNDLVLTKIGGSDTYGFWFNLTDLVKTQFQNETLTWSIEIKASRNMTLRNVGFETNGLKQVNITTEWQKISHTFINKFTNTFAFVFYNPTTNFNNGDKIYIKLPKLEKGDVATEWSPAYEDLRGRDGTDGHSLTASLWFTGGYVNNVTNNVKLNLKVFYDGREIRDFRSNIAYKGGGISNWATQSNPTIAIDNTIVYKFWSDGETDGTTLFALATVTYNGLQTVADARLDNVPDVRLVNETIKKYKTFESTLEGFTSVVGEIDTKIFSKAYFKNNLNNEDVEKTENDVYFNTKENLKANEYYTILADLENVPVNQKARIYSASDGGDEKVIQNGLNYWVVKYPSDQTRINLYPLGNNTKVKNVRIYKGDFRVKKDAERENLYSSYQMDGTGKFIQLNLNKNKINGNVYLLKFDASNFSNGDRWDVYARIGYNQENLTQVFKTKDNEFTFTINDNNSPNIIFLRVNSVNNVTLSNVEIYDVSTEYVKNSQVSKTESSIKQIKDEIDLKVSKDNVIASINASVETTGNGNQGVVKINADKVDISGVLSAYVGKFGNFNLGKHHGGSGQWITGANNFSVGMSDGSWDRTALWVNWGGNWSTPGSRAWFVTGDGRMFCKNTSHFSNDIWVSGHIKYGDGKTTEGEWIYSPTYKKIYKKGNWLYLVGINSGEDWITVDSLASDRRIKTNIRESKIKALDVINKFKAYSFTRNYKEQVKDVQLGIMAQDVKEYMYDAFVENPDGIYSYEPFEMQPYLIKAIQELSSENQQLKSQLNEMNERLTKLEDKINGNI